MESIENREKILKGAEELFMKFGVRSVSMDDVARHLGISKKTIYQYFKDKDDMVTLISKSYLDIERETYQTVMDKATNAIEEALGCTQCLLRQMQEMNPSLLYDLQKFHPEAWKVYLDFKKGFIRDGIVKNIARGIAEGYFREDLKADIIATFRLEQVQMAFDESIFSKTKYNLSEVQIQLFEHFIHGLLSDKGRKLFEKYKSNNNTTS